MKEYYFYLDSTPTHSSMKFLYKYPQREYPYRDLVETNARRSRDDFEYELLDTGVFDDDRYFDVFVEYAKAGPEDVLVRVTVCNRGPEAARLRVLPTLWFRTWSWGDDAPKPSLRGADGWRPVYGGTAKFQDDPHWRDLIRFYEYFHGDSGAGLGASHQTGWSGLVALTLDLFGRVDAKSVLEVERESLRDRLIREQVGGVSR